MRDQKQRRYPASIMLAVRVPPSVMYRLDALAADRGVDRSSVVREGLDRLLSHPEQGSAQGLLSV